MAEWVKMDVEALNEILITRKIWYNQDDLKQFFIKLSGNRFAVASDAYTWDEVNQELIDRYGIICQPVLLDKNKPSIFSNYTFVTSDNISSACLFEVLFNKPQTLYCEKNLKNVIEKNKRKVKFNAEEIFTWL